MLDKLQMKEKDGRLRKSEQEKRNGFFKNFWTQNGPFGDNVFKHPFRYKFLFFEIATCVAVSSGLVFVM